MKVSVNSCVWSHKSADDVVAFAAHPMSSEIIRAGDFSAIQDVGLCTGRYVDDGT